MPNIVPFSSVPSANDKAREMPLATQELAISVVTTRAI